MSAWSSASCTRHNMSTGRFTKVKTVLHSRKGKPVIGHDREDGHALKVKSGVGGLMGAVLAAMLSVSQLGDKRLSQTRVR